MVDPISDMLTRIRNAGAVNKETVSMPFSKMKQEIANVLKKASLILDFEKKGRNISGKKLELKLKYIESYPAIASAKRISKPGQRIYIKHNEIFPKKDGTIKIISTSKGIMVDAEARRSKLGGEVVCEIS
ncbi:MAG: 30S ribosomal protein S8 [bacterium]|nr:30S ribosomal protein S8 [bacterium]